MYKGPYEVRLCCIRINGNLYGCEALYGRCRRVYCGTPENGSVAVYDHETMERICTARQIEIGG